MVNFIEAAVAAIVIIGAIAYLGNSIGLFEAIAGATSTSRVFFAFGLVGAAVGELIGWFFKFGPSFSGLYLPAALLIALVFMFIIPAVLVS